MFSDASRRRFAVLISVTRSDHATLPDEYRNDDTVYFDENMEPKYSPVRKNDNIMLVFWRKKITGADFFAALQHTKKFGFYNKRIGQTFEIVCRKNKELKIDLSENE
jgi:hypothetical protein